MAKDETKCLRTSGPPMTVAPQDTNAAPAVYDPVRGRPIVLVGLMGVGKTSVGRKLAASLGRSFLDADHEIEKAAGRTVAEIFQDFGETSFREGERRVIARVIEDNRDIVLATGGGAFVDDQVRALVHKRAVSIWLNADVDVLVERTARRNTRPLLKTGDPKEILQRLSEERTPFYQQADIHIQSGRGPASSVVKSALEALTAFGKVY